MDLATQKTRAPVTRLTPVRFMFNDDMIQVEFRDETAAGDQPGDSGIVRFLRDGQSTGFDEQGEEVYTDDPIFANARKQLLSAGGDLKLIQFAIDQGLLPDGTP